MAADKRDWDKELAKIDALMAKQKAAPPSAAPVKQPSAAPVKQPAAAAAAPAPAAPARAPAPSSRPPGGKWRAWTAVGLGVVLGAAITQWPYPHVCGFPLAGYLAAVAVVIGTGVWGSVATWRQRMGGAHVGALAVLGWGLGLAALEVLPRIGYAQQSASWFCGASS